MGKQMFKITFKNRTNEFHRNFSKIINFFVLENYLAKLKCAGIDFIRAMYEKFSPPIKMHFQAQKSVNCLKHFYRFFGLSEHCGNKF